MDIITTIKYMFLGLLQGVTEPIPVSSSGHLVIARELFGIEAKGLSFEIFLNNNYVFKPIGLVDDNGTISGTVTDNNGNGFIPDNLGGEL